MSFEVADEVRAETTKCPNDFACLAAGQCGDHELCDVGSADGKNVLFLMPEQRRFCPYSLNFGGAELCTCPTHYAIHRRYGK